VLALADPGPDDVVLDIGCGDGRILVEAVRHFGCRARGIEIDPALGAAARRRVNKAGLDDRIEIVVGDGSTVDLSTAYGPATVVFLFLPPERISSLLPRVLDQLGPGGRVVAHEQLAVDHPVEPTRSRLVVEDGVTVAHLWTR
jgi:cyclopropane fatty-acyl-phospholipid synthase-like methyltransferase